MFIKKDQIIYAKHESSDIKIFYLPPSENQYHKFVEFDNNDQKEIYLTGWLFRNPKGIIKYRDKIVEILKPKQEFEKKAKEFILDVRKKFKNIIGVHIRQGDYKEFYDGQLFFSSEEVSKILFEFLKNFNLSTQETCFIICSDENIEVEKFEGLNFIVSKNFFITDMLILSLADKIIGSDSTFGAFASYYGNKSMVIFKKEGIDWGFYQDRENFFEDKYLTSVHF